MKSQENHSVNPEEIAQFAKDSKEWWDESGPFAPLHKMNPMRMAYIKGQICEHFDLDLGSLSPFTKLDILDVGCGGGLICEPLSRLGGNVMGIDADEQAIEIARDHAEKSGVKVSYENKAAENMNKKFDVVLALEIIEHVDNLDGFIKTCAGLLKPNGLIVFSTLNRTGKSFALGIVAAEYILRWVPRGTHSWKKFVKPSELARMMKDNALHPQDVTGLIFNPLSNDFTLNTHDTDVNYFMSAANRS